MTVLTPKRIGLTIVALVVFGLVVYARLEHGRAVEAEKQLNDYQAAATAVIQERLRAEQAEAARVEAVNKDLKERYEAEKRSINARWAGIAKRMRDEFAARQHAPVPETPATGPVPDGGDSVGRFAEALERCDRAVAQLRKLQEFIRSTR